MALPFHVGNQAGHFRSSVGGLGQLSGLDARGESVLCFRHWLEIAARMCFVCYLGRP